MLFGITLSLIVAFSANALEPLDFMGEYAIQSDSADCSDSLIIEERTDWLGNPLIGVSEVGSGLMCTFQDLNEDEKVNREDCPTAGPQIPGCRQVTTSFSTFSGNTLYSERTEKRYLWAVLSESYRDTCEVVLEGDTLTYTKERRSWKQWQFPATSKSSCNYVRKN